jgi:hypothetical protein
MSAIPGTDVDSILTPLTSTLGIFDHSHLHPSAIPMASATAYMRALSGKVNLQSTPMVFSFSSF